MYGLRFGACCETVARIAAELHPVEREGGHPFYGVF